ncbi:hypothetical protein G443_000128 [Actinoalloteichus cyanogriseus DSM 43889]|uniref:HTH hxlR-type domain-containing protein n=1 Tax=Actinoalloteichus caeruleus DSM 43889 TaxID=1120930 RepID=A0ABT1JBI4_ACTCY|nr:hypothetical protein [Actinoalloteichus caeruleus DSM 43889]
MVSPYAPATRLTHAVLAGRLDRSAPVTVLTATACRVHGLTVAGAAVLEIVADGPTTASAVRHQVGLSHPAWEAVRKHLQRRHLLLRGVARASPAPGAPVLRRHQLTEGGRALVGRLTPLLMIILDYFEFQE